MSTRNTAAVRHLVAKEGQLHRPPTGLPCYRTIIAVDVEGSTTKLNSAKAQIRASMYELFEQALLEAGIAEQFRDPLVDRGDGILALVHPQDTVPKTTILDTLVPSLGDLLAEHARQYPEVPLRMRIVVHAGEVHYDQKGCYGEALDLTFRLLDAPIVKRGLKQSDAPLVLVVSDGIYQSIIRHGYQTIDKNAYRTTFTVRVAGQRHRGWIQTSGAVCRTGAEGHSKDVPGADESNCVPLPHAIVTRAPLESQLA